MDDKSVDNKGIADEIPQENLDRNSMETLEISENNDKPVTEEETLALADEVTSNVPKTEKSNNQYKVQTLESVHATIYVGNKRNPKPKDIHKPYGEEFKAIYQGISPHQQTVSSYHPTLAPSLIHGDILDENYYARSQVAHRFSTTGEPPGSLNNTLANNIREKAENKGDVRTVAAIDDLLEKGKVHSIGANPAFPPYSKKVVTENVTVNTQKPTNSQAIEELRDRVLEHKLDAVEQIVNATKAIKNTLFVDEKQLGSKYPCVIVRMNDEFGHHKDMKNNKISKEYDMAYAKFVSHLLLASINYQLYLKKVGPYLDRRQSFGFLTPTASDVGTGIRVSLGLVPNEAWKQCVIDGIKTCDQTLAKLWEDKAIKAGDKNVKPVEIGMPHRIFLGDFDIYGHKLILREMIKNDSPHPVDFIASLNEKTQYQQLETEVKHENYFADLTNNLRGALEPTNLEDNSANQVESKLDDGFMKLTTDIDQFYSNLLNKPAMDTANAPQHAQVYLDNISDKMNNYRRQALNEVAELEDIYATSESEDDSDLKGIANAKEKYYTPSGMSALAAPLFAYKLASNYERTLNYMLERYAYFEIADWTMIEGFKNNQKNGVDVAKPMPTPQKEYNYKDVDMLYIDANPCFNDDQALVDINKAIKSFAVAKTNSLTPKMLVIDITSATKEQRKEIIKEWKNTDIPLLCFANSGLKNQQFGFDTAHYGKSKLLINNNSSVDMKKKAGEIAFILKEITRGTSSPYATHVIRSMRQAAQKAAQGSELEIADKLNQEQRPNPENKPRLKTTGLDKFGLFSSKQRSSIASYSKHKGMSQEDKEIALVKQISLAEAEQKENMGPKTLSDWGLTDVGDDGNCFYYAAEKQLEKIAPDLLSSENNQSPSENLRLIVQKENYKDKEWADDEQINGLAKELDVIIAVVDTRTPEAGFVCRYWDQQSKEMVHVIDEGKLPEDKPIIRLAYTGNHFLSVDNHPKLQKGVLHEPFELDDNSVPAKSFTNF